VRDVAGKYLLGVDAGGTFTDFVLVKFGESVNVRIHKTLSTPAAPEQAIIEGLHALGLSDLQEDYSLDIVHGSTVATNALLEGKLARTAYITNYGFKDTLQLARQTRPELYSLDFPPKPVIVPEELRLETGGRVAADGSTVEDLSRGEIEELLSRIKQLNPEAIAINLLFSFLDDRFERKIESALIAAGHSALISRSSEVLPEYKEYERGMATWLNAALGPVVNTYLGNLSKSIGRQSLQVMQSSGETIAAEEAAASAVHLLLSGPAGGLTAVRFLAKELEQEKIISFDMGGTSTDVALLDGEITSTNESVIGFYPVAVPMVDMHTIGAGGGSIAFVDQGGMLQVGPRSAGAKPGPACYDKGGVEATVTDANLILGRLLPQSALAGSLKLNRAAALNAIQKLADELGLSVIDTATGIVEIANEHMAKAIGLISVNRGHDPKEFLLCSFGGAGGLHICAIADAMGMSQAMIPVHGGVLSALGMVTARRGRQFSRTLGIQFKDINEKELKQNFEALQLRSIEQLSKEGIKPEQLETSWSADIRYCGQSYSLNLPWISVEESADAFQELHRKRYGFGHKVEIELLNIRVKVEAPARNISLPRQLKREQCNKPEITEVFCIGSRSSERTSNISEESGEDVNHVLRQKSAEGQMEKAEVYARDQFPIGHTVIGPAIITEYSATSFIEKGWNVRLDDLGNLILGKNVERAPL